MQLLHPHLFGVGIYWRKGADAAQVFSAQRGTERSQSFLNSPMGALYEGAAGVRQRLDLPDTRLPFPLLYELRAEGLTDYAALPLAFSDGKPASVSASRRGDKNACLVTSFLVQ